MEQNKWYGKEKQTLNSLMEITREQPISNASDNKASSSGINAIYWRIRNRPGASSLRYLRGSRTLGARVVAESVQGKPDPRIALWWHVGPSLERSDGLCFACWKCGLLQWRRADFARWRWIVDGVLQCDMPEF